MSVCFLRFFCGDCDPISVVSSVRKSTHEIKHKNSSDTQKHNHENEKESKV